MNIEDLQDYELELLKGSYINHGKLICSMQFSDQFANIKPLFYLCNNAFYKTDENVIRYGASFKENRYDIDNIFQPLNERFIENELFILNKFQDNYNDNSRELYFAYGNETNTIDQEVLEIYNGEFLPLNDYFIPKEKEALKLISGKHERGSRHFYYIQTESSVFGPFITNSVLENKVLLAPIHSNQNNIYKWDVNKYIDDHVLKFHSETSSDEIVLRLITNGWLDIDESVENIKFLTDDQLFGWLRQKINISNQYSKNEIEKFKQIFQSFQNSEIDASEKILFERSLRIFNESITNQSMIEEMLSEIPETKAFSEKFDQMNYEIEELSNKKTKLENDSNRLGNEVNEIKAEKKDIEEEIESLKSKLEEISKHQISEAKEKNEELKKLINEKSILSDELSKIEKYQNLKVLEEEINEKKSVNKYLEENKKELDDSIKSLSQEFIETQKSSQEKLRELVKSKTHFDFISGRDFSEHEIEEDNKYSQILINSFLERKLEETQFVSYEKLLIDEVAKIFRSIGRDYKNDFIANAIISIFQNTSTVFAGLPGTGKTSFARILSKIFVKDGRKRVEIPVSKGWTSQKDLMSL